MLDINDVDFKLLKMSESLLEKTRDETLIKKTLDSYRELAIKIDQANYNKLIEQINNINHNHSLEDELEILEQLEDNYNQLNEMQCRFRKIYGLYIDDELKLSDINNIEINKIRERKDNISGYLINAKNIADCKNKLEEYNEQLIIEEKKRNYNYQKFQRLEEELKNAFLNAEGRINALEKYTSVKNEYKKNGFDLNKLFNDETLMDIVFNEVSEQRKEQEEVLETCKICYDKVPNQENKDILDSLRLEAINARYRLSLIKIAKLINNYEDSYDKLIEKREQLLDLIKKRVSYLNCLGTNFIVDPFSRIKIQEQIGYIDTSLEDNSMVISRIRKSINELSNRLDEMIGKNSEFLKILNTADEKFTRDSAKNINTSVSLDNMDVLTSKLPQNNEIVGIKDLPNNFKLASVYEKSTGVIKRVNEMIKADEITEQKNKDELDDLISVEEEIFPEQYEEKQEKMTMSLQEDVLKPIFLIDNIANHVVENQVNNQVDSLFQDNIDNPFGGIEFFDERRNEIEVKIDDILSNESNKQVENNENEYTSDSNVLNLEDDTVSIISSQNDEKKELEEVAMPEVFWETKQITSEEVESLDEQIKKLKLVP